MTVIDLARPTTADPALRATPAATSPTWTGPTGAEQRRRPPTQYWCLRCARWHDRADRADPAGDLPDDAA